MNVVNRRPPNIIVFMVDQQKAPESDWGYPCSTPNLNRLRSEGLHFTDATVPSPLCSPSRASFFTGLLPSFHGIYNNIHFPYAHKNLDPSIPNLASILKSHGYRTARSGKWHLSESIPGEEYGFDEVAPQRRKIIVDGAKPLISFGIPPESSSGKTSLANVYEDAHITYGLDLEIDDALGYLNNFSSDAQTPFFLFASTSTPHVPWDVSRRYFDRVPTESIVLPDSFSEDLDGVNEPNPFEYNGYDYNYWRGSSEELHEALRCYYAFILKVDEQLGRLLDTVRKLGMEENTLFIFCSDHGEMAGAHNLIGKGFDFYDELMHIPMILKWPGKIETGKVCHLPVNFQDIMPTVCDAVGIPSPDGCRGLSLRPTFSGQSPSSSWREWVLFENYGHVFPNFALGLRSQNWLYIFHPTGQDKLFDRTNDPGETRNLVSLSEYEETLKEMRFRLLDTLKEINHPLVRRVATHMAHNYSIDYRVT